MTIETAAILKLVDEFTAPAKHIVGASSKLDKTLTATQKQLAHLKSDRAEIAAFTRLEKQSHTIRQALTAQQQKVKQLAMAYKSAQKPTKKLTAEFDRAKQQAAQLKKQYQQETVQLEQLKRSLKSTGRSTSLLSRHQKKLDRDIDRTTKSLRQQERALKQHNATMQRMRKLSEGARGVAGKASLVGAGGLGAAWLGGRALGAAGEYKALLADVAVTAGMSDKEVTQLKNTLSELTDVTYQSRKMLGEGAKVLIASGLDLEKTLGSLPAIGKTATAAEAEVQEVARTAFALIDNWSIPTQELGRAMDMLTESGKLGRFELRDMAQYFPSLTAQAKRLGLEGAEGVATLGSALQIALRGAADPAEPANNMRNFLAKVTSPETIKRAADIYGINLERELKAATQKGLNPLEFMLGRIQQLTQGDAFRIGELFGDLQVQQFLTPMMANLKDYEALKKTVLSASGAVDQDLKRRVELDPTLGWKNLADDIAELRDEAIDTLLPVLKELLKDIKPILQSMSAWIKENPTFTKWIMVTVASVIALTAVLAPLIALIASSVTLWAMWRLGMGKLFVPMNTATKSAGWLSRLLKGLGSVLMWVGRAVLPFVGKAILWLGRALLANPIGLLITAIAGGAYLIIKHWEPIKAFFADLWQSMREPLLFVYDMVMKYSPFGLLLRGLKKLKGFMTGLWGGEENKVAVEATQNIKQLPANDAYYRADIKPFMASNDKKTGTGSQPYTPLRQTNNSAKTKSFYSNPTINIYASPSMSEETLTRMATRAVDKANRQAERRHQGRLHEG